MGGGEANDWSRKSVSSVPSSSALLACGSRVQNATSLA